MSHRLLLLSELKNHDKTTKLSLICIIYGTTSKNNKDLKFGLLGFSKKTSSNVSFFSHQIFGRDAVIEWILTGRRSSVGC